MKWWMKVQNWLRLRRWVLSDRGEALPAYFMHNEGLYKINVFRCLRTNKFYSEIEQFNKEDQFRLEKLSGMNVQHYRNAYDAASTLGYDGPYDLKSIQKSVQKDLDDALEKINQVKKILKKEVKKS